MRNSPARALAGAALLALPAGVAAGPTLVREAAAPKPPGVNVHFLARLDEHPAYTDVWGYTAPGGREYALAGTEDGVAIVDISDRRAPVEVSFVPGPHSGWRDLKTYLHYLYVVNESGGGLQVVDISDPANPRPVAAYLGFATAHNVGVDFDNHALYVAGTNTGNGGVTILRLNDPRSPRLGGVWDLRYAHDVHARGDRMFVSAIDVASLYVVDISDLSAMETVGTIRGYPSAFTHNAWPNRHGTHVLTTDEVAGAFVRMWNLSALPAVVQTDAWRPVDASGSTPHNVHVRGDHAYVSWYTAGVRVLDVTDPANLREVAWFDTYPSSDSGSFSGCWGVFPHWPLSPGLFVATDRSYGLFVLKLDGDAIARGEHVASAGPAAGPPAAPPAGPRPAPLALGRPAPNPLPPGGSVRLAATLAEPGPLEADGLDVAGRRVRTLRRGLAAGRLTLHWDGRDDAGRAVAAGAYLVRVRAGGEHLARLVLVVR